MLPSLTATGIATHQFITATGFQPAGVYQGVPTFKPYQSPTANYFNGNVQLVQPLINAQAVYAIGTAATAEDAAKLSLDDIKRTLALAAANAIVGVVTAERVAELNRIGLRQALERLEITQRKKNLGAANGLDVLRVQQDAESARATLVTGDESLRQAREALGLALGVPEQVGVARDINLDGLQASATSICKVARSIDERADIAAQRKRIEVAERGITDAKLQFLPTLNAQSTVSTTTVDTGLAPNTTWNIQAILTIPIWDGGARYGNLRVTRAQQDEAEQTLESLRRQATLQVEQARRAVVVAEQSRLVASNARALAAESDRLTRVGYQEGQGTSLELVVAAEQLRQAEVNLALQEFGLVKARIGALLALATCPW
jgi:outer membrane protein TolC